MPVESLFVAADVVLTVVSLYFCLLGPGHAWWTGRHSTLPLLFTRIALSVAWTTAVGIVLAAAGHFSLPTLVLVNGAVALAGYLQAGRVRDAALAPPRDRVAGGGVAALLVLFLSWPAFETFLFASDGGAYVGAAVNLARTGDLAKDDDLIGRVPPMTARYLFPSVEGQQLKSPYARMPGAMVVESFRADEAWPNFFPAPTVWGAIAASTLGRRHTGAYGPLFSALTAWAFFLVARRRLGTLASWMATAAVALNGAALWFGRYPLSEPMAAFFLWAGLVAYDQAADEGFESDAWAAGALLGTAALCRIEYALFLVGALLLVRWTRGPLLPRTPAPVLIATVVTLVAVAAEAALIPGAFASPLTDSLDAVLWKLRVFAGERPVAAVGATVAGAAAFAATVRRFGAFDAVSGWCFAGVLVAHAAIYNFLGQRVLVWLSLYVGWATLVVAAVGAVTLWRERHTLNANAFLIALVAATAAVVLFNPHVHPSLPWGMRRFLPLLLPATLLFAAVTVSRTAARSRVAATLLAAVVAYGVYPAATPLWGKTFYDGTLEQLDEFHAALPSDGTLLIDRRLYAHMLGAALWLHHDRNSLAVLPDDMAAGRRQIVSLTRALSETGPVYYVTEGLDSLTHVPLVSFEKVLTFPFSQVVLGSTYDVVPSQRFRYLKPVAVYRLRVYGSGSK